MGEVKQGSRKQQDSRETLLALLLGLGICAYLKVDAQLYTVFAACAVGKSGVFNWGNAKEHDANAKVKVAEATATP